MRKNFAAFRYGLRPPLGAMLALSAVVFGSTAAAVRSSPTPTSLPSATPLPGPQTATIALPRRARVMRKPAVIAKHSEHDPVPSVIGRWTIRGQLLAVTDEGAFTGTLDDLASRARASFASDGGSVRVEHAVKICGGTQNAWYFEGTYDALGRLFHNEAILALGNADAFRATYARPATYQELSDAHKAIMTLCVVDKQPS